LKIMLLNVNLFSINYKVGRAFMSILLIGAGNLGEAMLDGMLKKKLDVSVLVKSEEKMMKLTEFYPSLKVSMSKSSINISNKTVVLAVKPSSFYDIKFEGKAKAFVSVMAKVSLDDIKLNVDSANYIRIMPNIAAKCEKSVTTVTGDVGYKSEALKLVESIGKGIWVDSEDELNIATALAGSGPAFLAIAAEALTDGAVRAGLKRCIAEEMTKGLFEGFSALLDGSHPAKIKEEVMSPKGTTAAGIFELEKAGVRAAFMKAIEAAYNKASK
jgi:pyrroline-5-carboxylate reductase